MNDRTKNVLIGAGLHIIPKSISNAGCNAIWKSNGNCEKTVPIWYGKTGGMPNDDLILDFGLPAGLAIASKITKSPQKKQKLRDMAIGAAVSGIATFLNVWFANPNTLLHPSWLPFSASANVTYAGPENPKTSPIAPPANPQSQLVVGNYGGGGTNQVYKPNQNAPACAGKNANAQQLFV